MGARPNFRSVQIEGTDVLVEGQSGEDVQDVIDIRVVLVQGERVDHAAVPTGRVGGQDWTARFAVKDETGSSPDFGPGDVVAFGVETYREGLQMSWAQTKTIPG